MRKVPYLRRWGGLLWLLYLILGWLLSCYSLELWLLLGLRLSNYWFAFNGLLLNRLFRLSWLRLVSPSFLRYLGHAFIKVTKRRAWCRVLRLLSLRLLLIGLSWLLNLIHLSLLPLFRIHHSWRSGHAWLLCILTLLIILRLWLCLLLKMSLSLCSRIDLL